MASIASTLGIGSGLDTKALVAQLVAAQSEPKTAAITAKTERVEAQISGLSQLKSGITAFSSALQSLISGGSLSTQPTSGDTSVVRATLASGARLGTLASTVEVKQLATQQIVNAPGVPSADAPVGLGTLTFTMGTGTGAAAGNKLDSFAAGSGTPFTVTIDSTNNSLTGLAQAINAKNAGLTASIVNDGSAARLVIKGPMGAAQAFIITAQEATGSTGLGQFAFGTTAGTATLQQAAQDSITVVDGITVKRASNLLTDVIDGVKLELVKAADGIKVPIVATRPGTALTAAVTDFVGAYNELQMILTEQADPRQGVLSGDAAVRQMRRMLAGLTSTPLRANGAPRTLAELGVRTNRNGTLELNADRLAKMLEENPDAVEGMFNPGQSSASALIRITSGAGSAAAGSYAIENVIAAKSGSFASASRPTLFDPPGLVVPAGGMAVNVALDGADPVAVTLPEGTYASGTAFADAMAAAIKASPEIAGVVTVRWDAASAQLVTTSALLGSNSAVVLTADDAAFATSVGFDTPTVVAGINASGTIAGKPATAFGSRLFAAADSAAKGLVIQPLSDVLATTVTVDLGLPAALSQIATALTGTSGGLYTATARLEDIAEDLAEQKVRVDGDAEKLETRLTKQFAAMDSRVALYKQTQSFIEQQVAAWNAADS